MKVIGNYTRRSINEDGNVEITFTISDRQSKLILQELEKKDYKLEITELKNQRSIYQNNLMWELLNQISVARGGERANDDWEIYLEALERAGAKFEYIALLPEAEEIVKKQFRTYKLVNTFEHKGKTFNQYKVFYGSSKLTTTEMTKLIETVQDMAQESGIDIGGL